MSPLYNLLIPESELSGTFLIILGWITTLIIAPIVTYRFTKYRLDNTSIDKTDAETTRLNSQTVIELTDKLIQITDKFKVASDEYLGVKFKLSEIQTDLDAATKSLEKMNALHQDLRTYVEIFLALVEKDCSDTKVKNYIHKIRTQFFIT